MNLKHFINELNLLDVPGSAKIVSISGMGYCIQIKFDNGTITQIYPKVKMPWDTE